MSRLPPRATLTAKLLPYTTLFRSPKGRYAIVAARLEADVVLAHRYLRECLGQDEGGRPTAYNVAVARPLAEWPLARAALSWLRVLAGFSQRKSCAPVDAGAALLADRKSTRLNSSH